MEINENETNIQNILEDKESPPSILRLNILELLSGFVIGVLLTLSYRHTVLGLQSFRSANRFHLAFNDAKADLAQDFIWFFFLLGFLAAVSFIRFVRKQHHSVPILGQISPIGYLSFAWPILLIIPDIFIIFSFSFFICWAGILLIAVIIYGFSKRQYDNSGDFLPVLLDVLAFLPFIPYTVRFWELVSEATL